MNDARTQAMLRLYEEGKARRRQRYDAWGLTEADKEDLVSDVQIADWLRHGEGAPYSHELPGIVMQILDGGDGYAPWITQTMNRWRKFHQQRLAAQRPQGP